VPPREEAFAVRIAARQDAEPVGRGSPTHPEREVSNAGRTFADAAIAKTKFGARNRIVNKTYYRLSSQYAENGASTCSWTLLMDVIDACEGARPSGDTCQYMFDINSVQGYCGFD
jgi:hypothetical protein